MNKKLIVYVLAFCLISIVLVLGTLVVLQKTKQPPPPTPEERIRMLIIEDTDRMNFSFNITAATSNHSAPLDYLPMWIETWDVFVDPLNSTHVFANISCVWAVRSDYHVTYVDSLGNITYYFKTLEAHKIKEGYDLGDGENFKFYLWAYYKFPNLGALRREISISRR